jgi:subtilisin family serine protease
MMAFAAPIHMLIPPEITASEELAPRLASQGGGNVAVLVELEGAAAARTYAAALTGGRTGATSLARQTAATAALTQINQNQAQQQTFGLALAQSGIAAAPLYSVTKAFNGLAYRVDQAAIPALRAMPGVKAVHLIKPEYPTLSTSVPFIGTAAAWTGAAPLGVTGTGVRIGIIDTGVDYQHPAFGGSGLLPAYQANDRTVAPDAYFPSARVVGGTDLAGDAYDGGNAPVPDPDPMDCNGHGTHVASTAAGGGVKADGTPFTGPYDGSTPFSSLRIGPGVAPQASIYAIRVFGCAGSTNLTVQGIEWALDPNGDGNLSDHLDVINMSLGSAYGSLSDTTAMAADNAAYMGMVVVASAGNSGDSYFIGGSPGSGQRVTAVAASADSGVPYFKIRINSPAAIAGEFGVGTASMLDTLGAEIPQPAGETSNIVLASPLNGCTALTNSAAVAGKIVYIDRGVCEFKVKYDYAVAAGASGVVIGNNVSGSPISMGGGPVASATKPMVMVSLTEANAIKAQIALPATVNVTLLSAANSGNLADTIASFSSRGPVGGGIGSVKPDLAAPGVNISAAQTGIVSGGFDAGGKVAIMSGTSMAAPHVAGMMALLVQRFPDRSAEEIKAMAMNTALHDLFQYYGSVNRIGVDLAGAGRIDPTKALQGTVLAYNNDVAGAVSLSFVGEVLGSLTQTKKLRVENHGVSPQTFNLVIDTVVAAPGVSFSFPSGASVSVPAGGTAFVDVQVSATAATMDHTRDPSAAATQANTARHYLTNASGYVSLTQSGVAVLRVPFYAALRPASSMRAPAAIVTGGNAIGSTAIELTGAGVCTGSLAGSSCSGAFPVKDVSLVSPFELQVNAPINPALPRSGNIKLVGVAYDAPNNVILFGVSAWGDWGSPNELEFDISVDAGAGYNRVLYNTSFPTGRDVLVASVYNVATQTSTVLNYLNLMSASSANTVPFGTNVMVLAASPAQLGLAPGTTKFNYKVDLYSNSGTAHDSTNVLTWDYQHQGLDFSGVWLAFDLPGAVLPVAWNTTNMSANASLGALLLHHHNISGQRAEVVNVSPPPIVLSVPSVPNILSIKPGPERLTVTLQQPGDTGGGAILSYSVTCSASGQPSVTATSITTTVVVTGLVPEVSYGCTASASNARFTSQATAPTSATPRPKLDLTPILMLLLD